MSSGALNLIGHALGLKFKAPSQKQAFEYVINNSNKSPEELADDIFLKGKTFCNSVTSSAGRIVSNLVNTYHLDLNDEELIQKWNNRFSEEERSYFKEFTDKPRDCSIQVITNKSAREEAAFSVKVMRNATEHYLKDIKANGRMERLNSDELEILNKVTINQQSPDLTPEESRDYQLWKEGYLQCINIYFKER